MGGGEVQRGRYYARVVLSTAEPSASLNNAVNELLRVMRLQMMDAAGAITSLSACAPTPTDSSNATGPATVAQQDATATTC